MNPMLWRYAPLAAVAVAVFSLTLIDDGADTEATPPPVAVVSHADGDTTEETINTLIAEVEALDRNLRSLGERNEALRAEAAAAATRERELRELKRRLSTLEQRVQKSASGPRRAAPAGPIAPRFIEVRTLTPAPPPVGDAADPTKPAAGGLRPVYTIAPNSILFDAVALTALVGRVPVDGEVRSPFPVKVLVGGDNVAAGGAAIPGLRGMLFSGTAVGDRALSCVSVQLRGATFLFADGTIRNFGDSSWAPGASGEGLGWLSDPAGLPCLPGALLSNATRQAAWRVLLGAAGGYAGAGADSQLSRISTPDGGLLESLSGDAFKFRRDRAWRSLADEWARFVEERAAEDFDAVYIPPGREVIVHITRQLPIDYSPDARRLAHGVADGSDDEHARLD